MIDWLVKGKGERGKGRGIGIEIEIGIRIRIRIEIGIGIGIETEMKEGRYKRARGTNRSATRFKDLEIKDLNKITL